MEALRVRAGAESRSVSGLAALLLREALNGAHSPAVDVRPGDRDRVAPVSGSSAPTEAGEAVAEGTVSRVAVGTGFRGPDPKPGARRGS